MRRYILLALIFFPFFASAEVPLYTKIIDANQSGVLVRYGDLEVQSQFLCNEICTPVSNEKKTVTDFPALPGAGYASPDKQKAFVRYTETVDNQIVTYNALSVLKNGAWTVKTKLRDPNRAAFVYWTPDSTKFLIVSEPVAGRTKLSVYDIYGTELYKADMSEKAFSGGSLSPNGRFFAFYSPLRQEKKGIVLIDMKTGLEHSVFTKEMTWDLMVEENALTRFSPDSKKLAYLDDRDGVATVYEVDLSAIDINGKRIVPATLFQISDFIYVDAQTVAYTANTKENPTIWNFYINGEKVVDNASYAYGARLINGKIFALAIRDNITVPVLINPITKTYSYFEAIKPIASPDTLQRTYISDVGVYIKNPAIPSKDLIVWLHGGPYRQVAMRYHSYGGYGTYDWVLEQVAKTGTRVLKLDYSGSYGYGRTYAEKITKNMGAVDVDDVARAIDVVKKLDATDNVYLVGNSYGGYLSLKSIVEKPQLIDGVISINGVTDWKSLLHYMRTSIFNVHFGGIYMPRINTHIFDQSSIIQNINNLSRADKIIIIQGEKDSTINPDQAYTLQDVLQLTNKNSRLITIPDEDHSFAKRSSMETICRTVFDLVEKVSADTGSCVWK